MSPKLPFVPAKDTKKGLVCDALAKIEARCASERRSYDSSSACLSDHSTSFILAQVVANKCPSYFGLVDASRDLLESGNFREGSPERDVQSLAQDRK